MFPTMATEPKTAQTAAPVMSDLDKIMLAMTATKVAADSALRTHTIAVCKANGVDFDSLTAGKKARWTLKVKEAAKKAGVSL